jgi:hypothetical protein
METCKDEWTEAWFVSKRFESHEEERTAFLQMWRDMLNGMLNDVLYGIATAVTTLSKDALTAETIMSTGIRYTVQRFVASDPPEAPITPIDASRYFVEKHLGGCRDGWTELIFHPEWVTLEPLGEGFTVTWKPNVCSFQAHCLSLKAEGHACICPRRLYHEQLIREMAHEAYTSQLEQCDPAGQGCRFTLIPQEER